MDRILRATAGDGMIKMAVISARNTVQHAREIHDCAPTAAAALGRTLCAASMLGEAMKEENSSLTIRINGGGPIGTIVAVSDHEGCVRGYVDNPSVDPPRRSDGKLNVGAAVGTDGMLTVSRDIGLKEPYIGSVELVSGEIAEDLTRYLLSSDQVASACALGVLVGADTGIRAAGGFLVQLMPGAPDDVITKLEDNIFMMDALTTILDEDGDEAVFRQVLKGFDWHLVAERPICYRCGCSRGRVETALAVIDPAELEEMIREDRDFDVSCQFCNQNYRITAEDLRRILRTREEKIAEN